jgi:hypothetical protein
MNAVLGTKYTSEIKGILYSVRKGKESGSFQERNTVLGTKSYGEAKYEYSIPLCRNIFLVKGILYWGKKRCSNWCLFGLFSPF